VVASYGLFDSHEEGLIKTVIAINGAAATAVLGFAPSLTGDGASVLSGWYVGTAFGLYIFGMMFGLISYLSMNLFLMFDGDVTWSRKPNAESSADNARLAAFAFGILSGLVFILSGLIIASALRGV
jgi:uncharacterized membrane protein